MTDHLNCLPPHLSAAELAPGSGSVVIVMEVQQCSAVLLQIVMTHCMALQDILLKIMLSTDWRLWTSTIDVSTSNFYTYLFSDSQSFLMTWYCSKQMFLFAEYQSIRNKYLLSTRCKSGSLSRYMFTVHHSQLSSSAARISQKKSQFIWCALSCFVSVWNIWREISPKIHKSHISPSSPLSKQDLLTIWDPQTW